MKTLILSLTAAVGLCLAGCKCGSSCGCDDCSKGGADAKCCGTCKTDAAKPAAK